MDPKLETIVRAVVRDELAAMRRRHAIPDDEELAALRRVVEERQASRESARRIRDSVLGWLVVTVMVGIGAAVWAWIQTHVAPPR